MPQESRTGSRALRPSTILWSRPYSFINVAPRELTASCSLSSLAAAAEGAVQAVCFLRPMSKLGSYPDHIDLKHLGLRLYAAHVVPQP